MPRFTTTAAGSSSTTPVETSRAEWHDFCDVSEITLMTRCFTVLVATASASFREMLCRVLSRNGYTTKSVSSAADALQAAKQDEYEAIVTDMHLPDCCGATLVRSLRREGVSTPAILLVEEETPRLRVVAAELGSTQCLSGPTDLHRLKAAIAAACGSEPGKSGPGSPHR